MIQWRSEWYRKVLWIFYECIICYLPFFKSCRNMAKYLTLTRSSKTLSSLFSVDVVPSPSLDRLGEPLLSRGFCGSRLQVPPICCILKPWVSRNSGFLLPPPHFYFFFTCWTHHSSEATVPTSGFNTVLHEVVASLNLQCLVASRSVLENHRSWRTTRNTNTPQRLVESLVIQDQESKIIVINTLQVTARIWGNVWTYFIVTCMEQRNW